MSEPNEQDRPLAEGIGPGLGGRGAPCPVLRVGWRKWRVGWPTQDAKIALELLVAEHAQDALEGRRARTEPQRFAEAVAHFEYMIRRGEHRVRGELWDAAMRGRDSDALLLASLLREHHPDATLADARALWRSDPHRVRVALAQVLPPQNDGKPPGGAEGKPSAEEKPGADDAQLATRAYWLQVQEAYDALTVEPWCWLPEQIRGLTDTNIANVSRAAKRQGDRVREAMSESRSEPGGGDEGKPEGKSGVNATLAAMQERGEKPSFEFLWANFYCHMPGMTVEVARRQYESQSKEWERMMAEKHEEQKRQRRERTKSRL